LISATKARAIFSATRAAELELRLGSWFRSLHGVDQEYYGRHDTPANDRLLSWEDQFLLMVEEALDDAVAGSSTPENAIPAETIRTLLARAIGSYLFDGIEWPHLVGSPLDDPDLVLNRFPESPEDEVEIVCMLPNGVPRAFWADPAFERILRDPTLSKAFVVAYTGTEQEWNPLPRDKTKALWYQLYGAIVTVAELTRGEVGEEDSPLAKARERVLEYVELLKNAPCY
jgi:hypothetical protein